MTTYTIEDYPMPNVKNIWLLQTNFELCAALHQFPGDKNKDLSAEAKLLVEKILAIPGVSSICIDRKQATIIKSGEVVWKTIIDRIHEAFRDVYERRLEISTYW